MSILEDLYDDSRFNRNLNHLVPDAVDDRKEKIRRRKHFIEVGERWLGHAYDLIGLFTLVTIVAILLKLVLN